MAEMIRKTPDEFGKYTAYLPNGETVTGFIHGELGNKDCPNVYFSHNDEALGSALGEGNRKNGYMYSRYLGHGYDGWKAGSGWGAIVGFRKHFNANDTQEHSWITKVPQPSPSLYKVVLDDGLKFIGKFVEKFNGSIYLAHNEDTIGSYLQGRFRAPSGFKYISYVSSPGANLKTRRISSKSQRRIDHIIQEAAPSVDNDTCEEQALSRPEVAPSHLHPGDFIKCDFGDAKGVLLWIIDHASDPNGKPMVVVADGEPIEELCPIWLIANEPDSVGKANLQRFGPDYRHACYNWEKWVSNIEILSSSQLPPRIESNSQTIHSTSTNHTTMADYSSTTERDMYLDLERLEREEPDRSLVDRRMQDERGRLTDSTTFLQWLWNKNKQAFYDDVIVRLEKAEEAKAKREKKASK